MTRVGPIAILFGALLPSCVPATAQSQPPAATYDSLLGLRFYPQTGGFALDDLYLVFPPAKATAAELVIRHVKSAAVATVPLRIEPTEYAAFARLASSSPPVVLGKEGDYELAIRIADHDITVLPFAMRQQAGDDPFAKPSWRLEGEWDRVAFLSARSDDDSKALTANLWTSRQELPGGAAGHRPAITVRLRRGEDEIANGHAVLDWPTWQMTHVELRETTKSAAPLRATALADGDYTLEYVVDDEVLRRYPLQVAKGEIVRPARNHLGAEPATRFVSPRTVARVAGHEQMLEIWWLERPNDD